MKVIQRGTMKVVPGKMGQAMELTKKHMEITIKLGGPTNWKYYRCLSGREEYMHTLIGEAEWDSLADAEAFLDKMMADKELQQLMVKWDEILSDHYVEFLIPMPMQE
jgi:hypothetical protein